MIFRAVAVLLGLIGAAHAQDTTYAGVAGASVIDAGIMKVTSGAGFGRTEGFEYIARPGGGVTLINTITAADGKFRVRARFDLSDDWQATEAWGQGLYDGVPVESHMKRNGMQVDIRVTGEGIDLSPVAVCEPDCFINMSPAALPMFVMTRHHSLKPGAVETFRWAGQDLDRVRTLSGGTADLKYEGEIRVLRSALDGMTPASTKVRHFTFVERIPLPDGKTFDLNFNLWTDMDHRPLGFQVGSGARGTVGFRTGWEDVKAQVVK